MLNKAYTLNKFEELLSDELRKEEKHIRILGDLDITYEDYCYLTLKLKGLIEHSDSMAFLYKFKLCIITAWVFSLRYGDIDRIAYDKVEEMALQFPQHHIRYIIRIVSSAFEEYGLNLFDIDIDTLQELFALTAIHTGISPDLLNVFFDTMEKSTHYDDLKVLEKEILEELSPRLKVIYKYIDADHKQKIVYGCREMYLDCRQNRLTEEELYEKYPRGSGKMLKECVKYCKMLYENQKNNKS